MLTAEDVAAFRKNGFAHAKGVFSAEELPRLRAANPMDDLWTDPRLVEMARALLGDTPVFYFLASYNKRLKETPGPSQRHIHHDARGTTTHIFNRNHGVADYPAIRMGIYFQDYTHHSGAIKVSPGSHKIDSSDFDEEALPYVNVTSQPGDVIIFSKRLLHSGFSLRSRIDPEVVMSPAREEALFLKDPDQFLPMPDIREAIFIDYCDHSEQADRDIKASAMDSDVRVQGVASKIGAEMIERIRRVGLDLRVDLPLVECCDAAAAFVKPNGNLGAGALPAVQEFLRLLPLAKEYSSYYPAWQGLPNNPEGCIKAMYRIAHYREEMRTVVRDRYMAG